MELDDFIRAQNRFLIGFDLALGTATLLKPDETLRLVFGHREPSDDAREAFRRCAPIWLTYAVAHTMAEVRGEPRDWWAVAWLRSTEIATDALWSRSRAFTPRGRRAMWFAGVSNLAYAAGFARLATRPRRRRLLR